MIRRRCVKRGHRWNNDFSPPLPVEFCSRWLCSGHRTAPWVRNLSPELADGLDQRLRERKR